MMMMTIAKHSAFRSSRRNVFWGACFGSLLAILTIYIPRLLAEEGVLGKGSHLFSPDVGNARHHPVAVSTNDKNWASDSTGNSLNPRKDVEKDLSGNGESIEFVGDPDELAEEKQALIESVDDPDDVEDEKRAAETGGMDQESDSVKLEEQEDRGVMSTDRYGANSSSSAKLAAPGDGPLCIFYDRPPRTGSTTIAAALTRCLRKRYVQPRGGPREARPLYIQRMMELQGDRIGVYNRHLYISGKDVSDMRRKCKRLLYITSCKPMRERIWSAAKFRFLHGTSVLPPAAAQQAMKQVLRDSRTEPFLESYPYLDGDMRPLELEESEKLEADYVIRAHEMGKDLGELLNVFGCPNEFVAKNTHTTKKSADPVLEQVELKQGDAVFKYLTELAERKNERGLKLARSFV